MRTTGPWLVLLVIAGCSFDPAGLGSHPGEDASVTDPDSPAGVADAPIATADAPISIPDAPVVGPPDATVAMVVCGNMTCTAPDVCCVSRGIGGGNSSYDCGTQCDVGAGAYACDGPEDCPGQDCCLGNFGSSCSDNCFGSSVACRMASDCSGGDKCCPVQGTTVSLCQTVCF